MFWRVAAPGSAGEAWGPERRSVLIAFMLLLYAAANWFLLHRGHLWIRRLRSRGYRAAARVFVFAYLLLAALPVAGALVHPSTAAATLQRAGNLWLGFCFYLFLAAMPLECVAKLRRKGRPISHGAHSAFSFWGGAAILLLTTAAVSYGMFHARQLRTVAYSVSVQKPAAAAGTLKIAFAADLHLGCQIGSPEMERMQAEINAMDADVVLLGGDLFDSNYNMLDDPARLAGILRGLHSRYGVYVVYGNHDVAETLIGGFSVTPRRRARRDPRMEEFLQTCGVRVLEDEAVPIDGGRVWLVGRLDGEKAGDGTSNRLSAEDAMALADPSAAVVVLEHEPVELRKLSELGADLVLSGHTHDGQFFPLTLAQKLIWENPYGLKRYGAMTSIVTSGVGLYGPPMRVMTNSEVAEISLNIS